VSDGQWEALLTGSLVRQMEKQIVRLFCRFAALGVTKDQINPMVQIATDVFTF
jgi:hypothetical protein